MRQEGALNGVGGGGVHSSDRESGRPLAGSDPQLPVRARAVAQEFLTALEVEERTEAEAVPLVVSELVTNAVRHAGGMTGFGLRAGPGTVTVTVEDASRVPPHACPADPAQPGGFGCAMVNRLAQKVDVRIQRQRPVRGRGRWWRSSRFARRSRSRSAPGCDPSSSRTRRRSRALSCSKMPSRSHLPK